MKKVDLALLCGLVISIIVSSFSSFALECDDIRNNMLRLHIVANSDNDIDQKLKYEVRDAVLRECPELFSGIEKPEAVNLAKANIERIEKIANDVVLSEGYGYYAKAEITEMYFNTRIYNNTAVAAGKYSALRITLGDGGGKNWWCVMFPPMCLPAASDAKDKDIERIEETGKSEYIAKFAVVEIIESIRDRLAV